MQARQFSSHIKLQGGTDCLSQQYFAIINSILKKIARAMLLIFLSYQYYQKHQGQIPWGNEGEGQ